MENDSTTTQNAPKESEEVNKKGDISSNPNDVIEENAESPSDFVSEVQKDADIRGQYAPNPVLAARILASNEEIADDLANKDKKVDINLKIIYGIGILLVLAGWVVFVIFFSWKQLDPCKCRVQHVSDTVFVALLTSATANILALPAIILKYLFPRKG